MTEDLKNWKACLLASLAFITLIGLCDDWSPFRLPDKDTFPKWASAPRAATLPPTLFYSPTPSEMASLTGGLGAFSSAVTERSDSSALYEILRWASSRWKHHGSHDPKTSDPITILKRAQNGERFRCVEFGLITMAAARLLGMPARVLKLRRKGVETAKADAGHVVAEVWLRDLEKWAFIDSQWGIIPEVEQIPLSVTEFATALRERNPKLSLFSASNSAIDRWTYPAWIAPYLYFIEFELDQRMNIPKKNPDRAVLTPLGVPAPRLFQREPIPGAIFETSDSFEFEGNPFYSSAETPSLLGNIAAPIVKK